VARLVIGPRGVAWAVTIAGVALASQARPPTARVPATAGSYTILAADFHVHSFPGDGGLPPWDLAIEARRRGLDVVVLTNHNSLASWRLAQLLPPRADGAMLLPGIELTSIGYHLAAIGVRQLVAWRQGPAAAAAEVHTHGGVAIAAHPSSPRSSRFDDAALDAIDGFEAASSNDSLAELAPFRERATGYRPSLAAIGASDFHYYAPLGVCRTFVFVTERSAAGVLDAVRQGRTVACDGSGETYGPAELADAVSSECRRVASARPEGWGAIDAISTGAAWLGLVALVALGARERDLE
jgi:hypothetical protein